MYHPETQSCKEVLAKLGVDPEKGLTEEEVLQRQSEVGLNIISSGKARSYWSIFLAQFRSAIVLLLFAATGISLLFGDFIEALAIFVVILLNAVIGFILEAQANRSMEALKSLEQPDVKVIRNGLLVRIPIQELVPGDLLSFEAGDLVGADARLLNAIALEVNESPLTGESVPVDKSATALERPVGLGDQTNMIFRGTSVTRGNGLAVVVFTGKHTEIGHIARMVDVAQAEEIPLNKKLNKFSKTLIWLTILIMVPFVVTGLLQNKDFYLMVETAIALAVAAIPEGLPIVATIALANGMLRLSKKKVLVRKLAAVETLGGTNIILTDKTGTLTENQLEVEETVTTGKEITSGNKLMEVMVLCNNAVINHGDKEVGDPVEIALLHWARRSMPGYAEQIRHEFQKITEIPFESETRTMTTVHKKGDAFQVSVKGATTDVLQKCQYYSEGGSIKELSKSQRNFWLDQTRALSSRGLKVLAGAYKVSTEGEPDAQKGLTIAGLTGLLDPARPDVAEAIAECKNAGIKVVMVTGDHPETARSIAQSIGLTIEENDLVVHGQDLVFGERTSPARLNATIYSRVTPEQKLRLVEHYQSHGLVVAMTGDGVNDAPALKKADIGVAMGLRGTEVAKEAADMVLQDDSFSSIISAIKQGRLIFNNIRNFVIYLLSCNLSEILVVSSAAFLNLGSPLLPLQILFLNLVTDVFPALALGMGRGGKKLSLQQPRSLGQPILTRSHWKSLIVYAFIITISVLGTFLFSRGRGFDVGQSNNVAFFTLAFAQLVHPFNLIRREAGLFKNSIVRNPHLWAAIVLCSFLLFTASAVSPFNQLLELQAITREMGVIIAMGSLAPLIVVRMLKWFALLD